MTPNSGILNIVLRTFSEQFVFGMEALHGDAIHLLSLLVVMELSVVALFWAMSGDEALGKFLRKIIFFSVFVGIINNYGFILQVVKSSFVETGTKAAGGVTSYIDDPSGILDRGIEIIGPLLGLAQEKVSLLSLEIFDALFLLIATLTILVSYMILAFQVFITRIEFGLISTLGLMLVPLAVFSKTSFMTEKIFGAIVSFGVKLMVLSFVISVAFPIIEKLTIPEVASWYDQIYTAAASIAIACLALHAPGVAAGLLAGSPSLHAGSVASGAALTAAVPTGAVMGGVVAVKGGVSATKAAAGALGKFGGGGGEGSAAARTSAAASLGLLSGGGGAGTSSPGAGKTSGATSTASDAPSGKNAAQLALQSTLSDNPSQLTSLSSKKSASTASAPAGLSRPEDYFNKDKSSKRKTSAAARAVGAYQTGTAALERTAQPSGSNVVPINRKEGDE